MRENGFPARQAGYLPFSPIQRSPQRWLIPRLTQFHENLPRIEVRLSSSIAPSILKPQNLDAAIRAGKGNWPDLHSEKLVDVELIPICSPAFRQCTS